MNAFAQTVGLSAGGLALLAAMTLGAAAIRGLTGFGMAIILVPLLGLVIRPDQAVVLAILLQLLIGPVGLRRILSDSHRASAVPIALCAMVATPLGVWLLAHTPPDVARLAIALIAIGAFLLVLLPAKTVHTPNRAITLVTGLSAGILTGFAAMPGPPVVPFYIRGGFSPATARASMQLVFFATAIAGTLASTLLGLVDLRQVVISLIMFPALLIGNWVGGLAFGRIAPPIWRSLVGLVLGVAGISALVRLLN